MYGKKAIRKNIQYLLTIKKFDPIYKQYFIDLYIKTFSQAPWSEQWGEKQVYNILNKILTKKKYIGLTAFYKNKPVGFIFGYSFGNFFPFNKIFYLNQLFVDSEFQNCGIGEKMIYKLFHEIKKKIKLVILLTKYKSIAEKFYQKIGFKKSIKFIQIKDKVIMFKILTITS